MRVGTTPGESENARTLGYSAPAAAEGSQAHFCLRTNSKGQERTEDDELDQAIQRVLRDVHIANSRNADLGSDRGDGHAVPTALF